MRCRSIFIDMTKRFEHGVLAAVVGLVLGLVMLVGLSPLDTVTSIPKASLRLAISVPLPAKPVAAIPATGATVSQEIFARAKKVVADLVAGVAETFIPSLPRLAGIDTLTGVFSLNEDEKHYQERLLKTTGALSRTFKQLDYDLDLVRSGEAGVPRLFLASLPGDLKDVRETRLRNSSNHRVGKSRCRRNSRGRWDRRCGRPRWGSSRRDPTPYT